MLGSFSRRLQFAGAEAYVGALDIVVISKPFSIGEELALAWALAQDAADVVDIVPLPDGRDVIFLSRRYERQSFLDAVLESRNHIALLATVDCNSTRRERESAGV